MTEEALRPAHFAIDAAGFLLQMYPGAKSPGKKMPALGRRIPILWESWRRQVHHLIRECIALLYFPHTAHQFRE